MYTKTFIAKKSSTAKVILPHPRVKQINTVMKQVKIYISETLLTFGFSRMPAS